MKSLKYILAAVILMIGVQTFGQSAPSKTETFKVYGECGMCKTRIEKAAKVAGVTSAEWNKDTKMMVVTFNPSVISLDHIEKNIAAVGHDTEKYKASDKTYAALPACCHYQREK